LKKFLLMGLILFFSNFSTISGHAEIIETGEQVELKEIVTKDFIYRALEGWIRYDLFSYYNQYYNAKKSVEIEHLPAKDIRVFLSTVTATNSSRYTHLVKIHFPSLQVKIDDKKEMIIADTLLYAVNISQLTNYTDSNAMAKSVKLLNHNHKEITK
jgi:hypothetical protein